MQLATDLRAAAALILDPNKTLMLSAADILEAQEATINADTMSMLDQFAEAAVQGLLSNASVTPILSEVIPRQIANTAYDVAEGMIDEKSRR